MGMYQSDVVAFAQFATAQVKYHQRVLLVHQPDGCGCCRHCGRQWPCDAQQHSLHMIGHYSQWALDADQETRTGELVRPYAQS